MKIGAPTMFTIYHNNRCGKSRCALQVLSDSGKPFETVEYLKNPPSAAELTELLRRLGKRPFEIVRTKEAVFQEQFKNQTFTDEEWLDILLRHPILIERPIVTDGARAWVARDEESLAEIAQLL